MNSTSTELLNSQQTPLNLKAFLQHLIERCEHGDINEECEDEDWREIYLSAKALLTQELHRAALAKSFASVPVEPTPDMYSAGYDVLRAIHNGPFNGAPSLGHAGTVFRAMLAVAPEMPLMEGAVRQPPRAEDLVNTEAFLIGLVREQLGDYLVPIFSGTRFVQDLGCDSIDEVELLMSVESTLGIEIAEQYVPPTGSIGEWAILLLAGLPTELQRYFDEQAS